jgi:alpha-glucosidase (family GH31 glycosyl hydrolase)
MGRIHMKKFFIFAILIASVFLFSIQGCRKGQLAGTVESDRLRLDVFSSPFSYEVREKRSGELILRNIQSAFLFQKSTAASEVVNLNAGIDFLEAGLAADGSLIATVRFDFKTPDRIELTIKAQDASRITQTFADQGEHYYGLWEYAFGGRLDNRGVSADMLGVRDKPDVNFSNGRAPFYMTSKKYAVYAETFAKGHFALAQLGRTSFTFDVPELKYHIIYGPKYADMLKTYNEIAGPSIMPPLWAFGSFWWRDDDHPGLLDRAFANAQESVLSTASNLTENRIHASAIWIDRPYGTGDMGWGNMDFDTSFPDPSGMISSLRSDGYNLLLWITNRCLNGLNEEAKPSGWLFDGYGEPWPAADVRKPETYDWFRSKLDVLVNMGVKGYKIDRGEEGEMPLSVQNEVTYCFHKLCAEGLAAKNGGDHVMLARSAYDRCRMYSFLWNGDTDVTFAGLRASIKNGLRSGMINYPFWGSDIGGYIGGLIFTKELFARWLEFGAYSPLMEVMIGPNRNLWEKTVFNNFDDELLDITRASAATHHDLIPYARSMMHQAVTTGMPVMRALALAFPEDESVHDKWDEYLYGSELLVAPVTVCGQRSRDVYLPEGRWIDYNDRSSIYDGGSIIKANAPVGVIPVFAKEGAIIPRGDILKANNSWTPDWKPRLRIEFFPAASGSSSFDYYTGEGVCRIQSSNEGGVITIDTGQTLIPGTADIYINGCGTVSLNGEILTEGSGFTYDSASRLLSVDFSGPARIEITGAASLFE